MGKIMDINSRETFLRHELLGKIIDNFKDDVRLHCGKENVSKDIVYDMLINNKYILMDRYAPLIGLALQIGNPSISDVAKILSLLSKSFSDESLLEEYDQLMYVDRYYPSYSLNEEYVSKMFATLIEFINDEIEYHSKSKEFVIESISVNTTGYVINSTNGDHIDIEAKQISEPISLLKYKFQDESDDELYTVLYHSEKNEVYPMGAFILAIHYIICYNSTDFIYNDEMNLPEHVGMTYELAKRMSAEMIIFILENYDLEYDEMMLCFETLLYEDKGKNEKLALIDCFIISWRKTPIPLG